MSTGDDIPLDLDGPHWRFALALYAQPGAAEACLFLQDRFGVDVNILLFAMFAATERGMAVTPEDVDGMDAAVTAWRREAVVPLRAIRRRLKQPLANVAGAHAELLRTQVKSAELFAEQIEQALLARWFQVRNVQPASKDVDLGAILWTVVAHFGQGTGAPDDAIRPLLLAVAGLGRGAGCS
jgi:uncharacterized protein (TIGR02444 family)